MKPLSIKVRDQELEVRTTKEDYAAALVRGIIGAAPVISPIAAEVITNRIPNQKLERIARFMKILEDRLKYVEEDILKQKIMSEEFADLLEDALPQAARALTDERRTYIANLLKTSMSDEQLDHLAKKKLLAMLNELNDAEILILYYYSLTNLSDKDAMRKKYPFVPQTLPTADAPDNTDEKQLIYNSYRVHIMDYLRFPSPDYVTVNRANLLLRYIGLTPGVYSK